MFIKNYSNILARILGIKIINDDNYIKTKLSNIKIPEFKEKIKSKSEDNKNDISDINTSDIESLIDSLLQDSENKEITLIKEEINKLNIDSKNINIEKFEKDNDSNGHIDFIFACTNIRAKN